MRKGFKVVDNNSSLEESVHAAASLIYQAYSESNPRSRPLHSSIRAGSA